MLSCVKLSLSVDMLCWCEGLCALAPLQAEYATSVYAVWKEPEIFLTQDDPFSSPVVQALFGTAFECVPTRCRCALLHSLISRRDVVMASFLLVDRGRFSLLILRVTPRDCILERCVPLFLATACWDSPRACGQSDDLAHKVSS